MSEPTGKYSITMPRDIADAAKARSGPSGLSAYVAAAVARQIERDNLNELIQVAEAEHGPVTDEEIQALRARLHQARQEQQARGGADARPFTHVLANRQLLPFEKTVGAFAYLGNGALEETCLRLGAEAVIGEFEDPWQRGQHDGRAVADVLSSLLPA